MSSATDAVGVPWRSSVFQTVLACSLIGVMGVPMISPSLPALRPIFGVSDAQIGLMITVYTLPGVLLTPFVGVISDNVGRRTIVLPLLFLFGIAGSLIALELPYEIVLVLRFFQGVGASGLMVLAITLIGDFYDGAQRHAVIGINGSAIGIGGATYPLIGGALTSLSWHVPFMFFGVSLIVGTLAIFTLEEPDIDAETDLRAYARRTARAILMPKALGVWLSAFSTFFLFYGAILTSLAFLLSDVYGFSPGQIGLLFSLFSASNATLASQYGKLTRRFPPTRLIALGFLTFGASLIGIRFAGTPWLIGPMLVGCGLGFGMIMPSLDTTATGMASEQLRASMLGVMTSMLWLGQTVGPFAFTRFAGGFANTSNGYRFMLLAAGTLAVLAAVTGLGLMVRRDGRLTYSMTS
jgi:MFS family permease